MNFARDVVGARRGDQRALVEITREADDERGEIVRAVVVLRDGFAQSPALTAELQDHVKAVTAPYKYPRRIDYVAELPKAVSGKTQRAKLRAQG